MNDLTTRFLNNFTQWHEVGLTLINRYSLCSYSIESHFVRTLLNLALLDSWGSFWLILFVKSKSKSNYEFALLICFLLAYARL